MFQQMLNWRTGLALVAILIVTGTIFYSRYVSEKIAKEERSRVIAFGESLKIKAQTEDPNVLIFTNRLAVENNDIPIIETDENGNPSGLYVNLDSAKVVNDTGYLRKMVHKFAGINKQPVVVEITNDPPTYNKYYYGESSLQNEVRYYPIVQLLIVGLFIIVTILTLRSSYRSVQNQVWAGMAKETAHQLGTPVSSLEGWVEMMKDRPENSQIVQELEKDVSRLRLVSDRFGKIGSKPQLEETDIVAQINSMVEYIRKRASGRTVFTVDTRQGTLLANVSPPLFDWVIENLLKNALDSMEGKGSIRIAIVEERDEVIIDVTDTGKGISAQNISKVFKPGFTTKKRGWGLGLSLSKRIIEQYHRGQIFVKQSEPGRGTTFRIVLKKEQKINSKKD
jgi:C4-dicarboxylate-specific signal transduction histidine kinase